MSNVHDKDDTDKLAQRWLSGKTEKGEPLDYHGIEKFRREAYELSSRDIKSMVSDTDSPYCRIYRDPIDLDLVHECLDLMQFTGEPLPDLLVNHLVGRCHPIFE